MKQSGQRERIRQAVERVTEVHKHLAEGSLVDSALALLTSDSGVSFGASSRSSVFASISVEPGIYLFSMQTPYGDQSSWQRRFEMDWLNTSSIPGFQHSPRISNSRLARASPAGWIPLYLGKSESLCKRVDSHLVLPPDKRTFALKLHARSAVLSRYKFRVQTLVIPKFPGLQILLRALEEALRAKVLPVTGRQ